MNQSNQIKNEKAIVIDKKKILLVEDNRGDVFLVVDALGKFGDKEFELVQAPDLEMALKRLRDEKFDAVLLDLSIPLFLGLEPLERIHRMKPKLPIVVLSGYNDPELVAEALQKGAKNFLVKGHYEGDVLVRMLHFAIDGKIAQTPVEMPTNPSQELMKGNG